MTADIILNRLMAGGLEGEALAREYRVRTGLGLPDENAFHVLAVRASPAVPRRPAPVPASLEDRMAAARRLMRDGRWRTVGDVATRNAVNRLVEAGLVAVTWETLPDRRVVAHYQLAADAADEQEA